MAMASGGISTCKAPQRCNTSKNRHGCVGRIAAIISRQRRSCLQVRHLAVFDHPAHQAVGAVRNPEAMRPQLGRKARDAQHPQRVLNEGVRDMPQQTGIQVLPATVRVDELAGPRPAPSH